MKRSSTSKPSVPKTVKHESLQEAWTEYYLFNGYASKSDRTQMYVKDSESKPKIFEDSKNKQIYATKMEGTDQVEYLEKDKDGHFVLIRDRQNRPRYPRSITSNKFQFPKDNDGNEMYIPDADGKIMYPIDEDGNSVYALNKDGHPIFIQEAGKFIYGKNSNGDEVYPKDNAGNEMYLKEDNKEYPATSSSGNLYYAKKNNGDEFYPKVFCNVPCPEKVDLRDNYEVLIEKGIIIVKDK